MPSHADIDPLDIAQPLLPHLELVDISQKPELHLRWRLLVTYITATAGRDATGKFFDVFYQDEDLVAVCKPFDWVIKNQLPLRWTGTSGFAERDWLSFESTLFPLSNDGEAVDMFMGVVHYGLR